MFECDISPSPERTDDVYDDLRVGLEINDMGNKFFLLNGYVLYFMLTLLRAV